MFALRLKPLLTMLIWDSLLCWCLWAKPMPRLLFFLVWTGVDGLSPWLLSPFVGSLLPSWEFDILKQNLNKLPYPCLLAVINSLELSFKLLSELENERARESQREGGAPNKICLITLCPNSLSLSLLGLSPSPTFCRHWFWLARVPILFLRIHSRLPFGAARNPPAIFPQRLAYGSNELIMIREAMWSISKVERGWFLISQCYICFILIWSGDVTPRKALIGLVDEEVIHEAI